MAYIGRGSDAISNVDKLDNITFSGATTYNLTKESSAFTPSGANNILISIDGVVQQNNFSVANNTIVFDFSPTSNNTCDWIIHYGVGVVNTPADGTVTTAKIADGAITAAKIADGTVVASDIADNAITLAKMASGTDGNIISYDASGNPVAIATGNDGQVLTSAGAGQPPAFESISAGTALTGSTNNTIPTVTGANAISGEANLTYNGTFLGVGSGADLGSGVHVKKADSGGSVMSDNDALVLEGSAGIGMTLLGGTSDEQTIAFGDSGDSDIGFIKYHHNTNYMAFGANASERMRITSDGRGLSQFTAKAWCSANGTGTPAILDSHNISSLSDHETGQLGMNFANNMANTNYVPIVNAWQGYAATMGAMDIYTNTFKATQSNGSSYTDFARVNALVFGD